MFFLSDLLFRAANVLPVNVAIDLFAQEFPFRKLFDLDAHICRHFAAIAVVTNGLDRAIKLFSGGCHRASEELNYLRKDIDFGFAHDVLGFSLDEFYSCRKLESTSVVKNFSTSV